MFVKLRRLTEMSQWRWMDLHLLWFWISVTSENVQLLAEWMLWYEAAQVPCRYRQVFNTVQWCEFVEVLNVFRVTWSDKQWSSVMEKEFLYALYWVLLCITCKWPRCKVPSCPVFLNSSSQWFACYNDIGVYKGNRDEANIYDCVWVTSTIPKEWWRDKWANLPHWSETCVVLSCKILLWKPLISSEEHNWLCALLKFPAQTVMPFQKLPKLIIICPSETDLMGLCCLFLFNNMCISTLNLICAAIRDLTGSSSIKHQPCCYVWR